MIGETGTEETAKEERTMIKVKTVIWKWMVQDGDAMVVSLCVFVYI